MIGNRLDPSGTSWAVRQLEREVLARFRELSLALRHLVVEEDAFALEPQGVVQQVLNMVPDPARPGGFGPWLQVVGEEDKEAWDKVLDSPVGNAEKAVWRFKTSAQKVQALDAWLETQLKEGVLATDALGVPWVEAEIAKVFGKAVAKSFAARRRIKGPLPPVLQGVEKQFVAQVLSDPKRLEALRLLSTRAFEELKGVTKTMAQRLNRVLANALVRGSNPKQVAREMLQVVDGLSRQRAILIARTELVHANAEGTLAGFEAQGVKEVGIVAEWSTAGDDRVCGSCGALEGVRFRVEDAHGLIPRHPNCRCAFVPAGAASRVKKTTRALDTSLRRETGSKAKRPGARSSWAGKKLLAKLHKKGFTNNAAKREGARRWLLSRSPTANVHHPWEQEAWANTIKNIAGVHASGGDAALSSFHKKVIEDVQKEGAQLPDYLDKAKSVATDAHAKLASGQKLSDVESSLVALTPKLAGKWDPALHPKDAEGKFAHTWGEKDQAKWEAKEHALHNLADKVGKEFKGGSYRLLAIDSKGLLVERVATKTAARVPWKVIEDLHTRVLAGEAVPKGSVSGTSVVEFFAREATAGAKKKAPVAPAPPPSVATPLPPTPAPPKADEPQGGAPSPVPGPPGGAPKKPGKLKHARKLMEDMINGGKTKQEIEDAFLKKYAEVGNVNKEWVLDRIALFHAEHTGAKKTTWAKTIHVPGVTKTKSVTVSEGEDETPAKAHEVPDKPPPQTKPVLAAGDKELSLEKKKELGKQLDEVVKSFPAKFKVKHKGKVTWAKVKPYEYNAVGSKIDAATGEVLLKVVTEDDELVTNPVGAERWSPELLRKAIKQHAKEAVPPPPGALSKTFKDPEGWVKAGRSVDGATGHASHHKGFLDEQGGVMGKLTTKQRDAVWKFTGSYSGTFNSACKTDTIASSGHKQEIDSLADLIKEKGHFKEPLEVLRGLTLPKDGLDSWVATADKGQALKFPAFSSTSTTHPFGGNVQLKIRTKLGLAVTGSHPSEHEVIMNKGWNYRVWKYEVKPSKSSYGGPQATFWLECLGEETS